MKKFFILSFILSVFIYACGPSVEGESKAWKNNLNALNKIKSEHPVYAKVIEEGIAKAQKVYDAAAKLKDEEAKAEKMEEANNILNTGCVGSLKNMESKINSIDSKIERLKRERRDMGTAEIELSKVVIEEANANVKEARRVMSRSEVEGDPCIEVSSAYSNLESSYKDIDRTISNFKRKKRDKKRDAKKRDTKNKKDDKSSTSTKTDTKKEAKMVKCEYCGVKNKATKSKCSSCGAAL